MVCYVRGGKVRVRSVFCARVGSVCRGKNAGCVGCLGYLTIIEIVGRCFCVTIGWGFASEFLG